MKWFKYLFLVIPIFLSTQVNASWIHTASERVCFNVQPPIDTATFRETTPDSIQVFVYEDTTSTTTIYSAEGAAYTCAGIDTTKARGSTVSIVYDQLLSTIVDGKTTGSVTIEVVCWDNDMSWRTRSDGQLVTNPINLFSILTASDNIGINWNDVSNPTTTLNLSNTTIKDINDIDTDSLMNLSTRTAIYLGCNCDSTSAKYWPLGSKPKDSVQYICIVNGIETVVATLHFYIHSPSVSSSNTVDSSLFEEK